MDEFLARKVQLKELAEEVVGYNFLLDELRKRIVEMESRRTFAIRLMNELDRIQWSKHTVVLTEQDDPVQMNPISEAE